MIKDRFPILMVDDMIDELYGAKYFTKLYLQAGYHQIRVQPDDVHKTAFQTHNRHYEYLVGVIIFDSVRFGFYLKNNQTEIKKKTNWNPFKLTGFGSVILEQKP